MISNDNIKRNQLLAEFLDTERSYVASLGLMQEYQNGLIATAPSIRNLYHNVALDVFSNLNSLVEFQRQFLEDLEQILSRDSNKQHIGYLFIKNVLNDIIEIQLLQSYLIKPLQRLLKYPLFLRELLKLSPENEDLKVGSETIRRISETLNEMQRKRENARLKTEFMKSVDDWKDVKSTDFGDLLLMEELPVEAFVGSENYHMLLFEKILLCTKRDFKNLSRKRSDLEINGNTNNSRSIPYCSVIHGAILLHYIARVEDTSVPDIGVYSLRVNWQNELERDIAKFSMKCMNMEQVTLWKSRIEKQVENQRKAYEIEKLQKQREQQHKEYELQQQIYQKSSAARSPVSPPFDPLYSPKSGSSMSRSRSNPHASSHAPSEYSSSTGMQGFNFRVEDLTSPPPEVPSVPSQYLRTLRTSNHGSMMSSPQSFSAQPVYQGYGSIMMDPNTPPSPRQRFLSDSRPYVGSQNLNSSQSSTISSSLQSAPPSPKTGFLPVHYQNQNQYQTQAIARSSSPVLNNASNLMIQRKLSAPKAPVSPSFVKIRFRYGDDSYITAMPVRDATLQELKTRIDRRFKQLGLAVEYGRISYREEISVGDDVGWQENGELLTDADVKRLIAASDGIMNLLLK
ncbi:hypothetical protein HK100_007784 [Physocladia obscura]|uniref:DH domain-containing protein n=1 Tax=Physocladia obscura TaxID=109957 RepID=A0AAD5XL27_9FUNG|nr:hypothetical protein HK100_007784 [Physocladia obscura]